MFGQDLSDANLFRRVRRGDTRSFGVLIHRHDATLRQLASRLLAEPDQVDAVLQKAYTKVWRTAAMARLSSGRDAVRNWLYRVVYNTCVDELRRQPPHSGPPPFTGPRVRLPNTSVERRLTALRALNPNERIPLVLVDSEGFDIRAAARILQRRPSEVASDLATARRHWRDLVIGPPEAAKKGASEAPGDRGEGSSETDREGSTPGEAATGEPSTPDGDGQEPSPSPDGSERTQPDKPVTVNGESGNGARPSEPARVVHAAEGAFDSERFSRLKRWFKGKSASDGEPPTEPEAADADEDQDQDQDDEAPAGEAQEAASADQGASS